METADVRKRIKDTIERARRQSAERRTHNAEASAAFEVFLQSKAVPVFQQVANVLRVEGYPFLVHTPAGSVRLASEKSAHDFIDMRLDTTARPQVVLRVERVKGRETTSEERPLKPGTTVQHLTDEDVLDAISEALMGLVDR